jgi:hypothetical protein
MFGVERQKCKLGPENYRSQRYDFGFGFARTNVLNSNDEQLRKDAIKGVVA